jgi:hypothetical protein
MDALADILPNGISLFIRFGERGGILGMIVDR